MSIAVDNLRSRFATTVAALQRVANGGAPLSDAKPAEDRQPVALHGQLVQLGSEKSEADLFLAAVAKLLTLDQHVVHRVADVEFGVRNNRA